MMAKELILLSKRRYEELLHNNRNAQPDQAPPSTEINEDKRATSLDNVNVVENQTQTVNDMFVEKMSDDNVLPGYSIVILLLGRKEKQILTFLFMNIMYTKILF